MQYYFINLSELHSYDFSIFEGKKSVGGKVVQRVFYSWVV